MAVPHTQTRLLQLPKLQEDKPEPILDKHVVACLNMFVSVQFLIGSFFFFTWLGSSAVYWGDWFFITGSALNCFISLSLTLDHWREMDHIQSEVKKMPGEGEEDEKNIALQELEEKGRELMESSCYLAASAVFAVGCVLFYPHLFKDEVKKEYGEEIGAYMFILGSFGFVIAAYYNALAMVKGAAIHKAPKIGSIEYTKRQIVAGELFLSTIGSVLFVTGSFLYRPSYATNCSHEALLKSKEAEHGAGGLKTSLARLRPRLSHSLLGVAVPQPEGMTEDFRVLCVNVMNQGTMLYLLGSALFVGQCGLAFWRMYLQKRQEREDAKAERGFRRSKTISLG
mmetsp:Transcript_39470/g.91610  ORF Transcript_39470/g.91610 Transcript_39470/m.91610 type:complete len:339 (-) Transcript_39470:132-1148(-)|eukprot:CAMPEP_0171100576 /NCGR_PEP_ID=MMETSP0766_2-20121228/53043_1 /TAXON_ID=439317 /ORGANISM="Gambierdiscus australes, Strain CAWD 149" /LENGTH=338 /DNA_ID=CAMNT_0011560429 /DNA_START=57 /DNA_END=1073 /DNA_ORIENTATION=+